ncbi:UDP-N-acetylmuramoyl-L-alanine--D-glutamate ligase [Nocardioides sp.]|uniref:UDP-N-acetylmuramoyl-L-alanine--D-glutamate ligase n=1 Tax=Nocardioides sp. TaxID=35761 RepID=UPI003518983F
MRYDDLPGRAVVVWGAGREGRAAHTELRRRGVDAPILLTGAASVPDDLADVALAGEPALEALLAADIVVKSPGVPHTSPEFVRAREHGVAVTSLTDLWLADNAARALGVTGTKGKSTASSVAHHLLCEVGVAASLVGNGGTPVTADDASSASVAVAEVSSYQAADLASSPRVGILTSLYPEHLPWHGSYEQYVHDKLNLFAHGSELVVVPEVDGELGDLVRARIGGGRVIDPAAVGITVDERGISWGGAGALAAVQIPLAGRHNHVNVALALAAVAAGFADGVDRSRLLRAVSTFAPLAHRLERVPAREDDPRRWVDDSLATAPEAVIAALETFAEVPVTLLLGGADRGLSFAPLRAYLPRRAAHARVDVVALGPAGRRWLDEGGAPGVVSRELGDFASTLAALHRRDDASSTSAVVLLSPGAPSFDEFTSYEERSAAFRAGALGA